MVDFRYHVVSIIAVFLALGTGIVLGSTALDRPIINDLKRRTDALSAEKQGFQDKVDTLERSAAADAAVTRAISPLVVGEALAGEQVTVITLPGVDKDLRAAVVADLRAAGARVAGPVRLQPRLSDPAATDELDDLVARLAPSGVALAGATPLARAAEELAAVLAVGTRTVGPSDDEAPGPTAAAISVLSGLADAGLLDVDGATPPPANVVVVVLPPDDERSAPERERLRAVAAEVVAAMAARAQAVTVLAPRAGAGGDSVLASLRADARLSSRMSSADSVEGASGRLVAILTIDDALRGRRGHYGAGTGADAPAPALDAAAR